MRAPEPLLHQVLRSDVPRAVQQLQHLAANIDLVVCHKIGLLVQELRVLLWVLLVDEPLEQLRLADIRSTNELDVDIPVRPMRCAQPRRSGDGRPGARGAHVHAGGRLHGCALEQLLVAVLCFLKLLLFGLRLRFYLLDLVARLRNLGLALLEMFAHRFDLLRLHNHSSVVGRELGRLVCLLLDLGESDACGLDALLELFDPALQRLLLGLQLQLDRLQLLVPLPELRCLLGGLLTFGHQGANLLGFLLQLLHLLFRGSQAPTILDQRDRAPQHHVDSLVLPALVGGLDLARGDVSVVLLGEAPSDRGASPRLNPHDLRANGAELPLLDEATCGGLDLHRGDELPATLQVHSRLLHAEQCLNMAGEDANGLVQTHLHLPAPARLDECRALDQQLQTRKLQALEGPELEEHHRLADRPR
mmetsp:Transcript_66996/g.193596  ORF Transcript_66996/g.193596 Transcript_66996/m.193596 type:complete len:418 (-) Transcript_66996:2427-3680(-)